MDQTDQYRRVPHPRRPPAHKSVSLFHSLCPPMVSPPCEIQVPANLSTQAECSPSSLRPSVGRDSSGESSNADKWFDKSNNDVTARVDNDPPFFLRNASSEDKSPPQGQMPGQARVKGAAPRPRLPLRTEFLTAGTDGSSTDDFRGVIDDLTVENKKLKRRLKRYEKLHDAHLKDDKLFEVRVHGLPTTKKKELEDMLRRFALGLQEQPSQPNSSMSNLYESIVPALKTHVTNATNGTNFADSAYASASASGQGSSAQSGSASVNSKAHFKPSAKIRQQNIHTYLHDIPEGLMPRQRPAMSEKAKKKMTVRRLEQIFSGKGAGKGAHHHPIQQEEVSQLAAKADRSAIEATGQRAVVEGNREACIMYDEREEHSGADERTPIATGGSNAPINDTVQKPDEHNFVRSSFAPEQRPTRPLDLDPQRAQVPIDNIDYIRHLGFSPADAYTSRSPEEGHGWIYLNLLINMAQLHTINVTPEFVKQALQEYSSRFELSDDGRKVRWRRSSGYARLTSDADYTPSTSLTGSAEDQNPRKRIKLSHASNDLPHSQLKGALGDSQSKLAYTPLFFHQRSNEDSDISSSSSDEDDTDSPHLAHQLGGASSGATNPTGYKYGRAPVKKSKKRGNGPIIFYNNARFCTDLSGESKTEAAMAYNPIMYHVTTTHPVGVDPGPESGDDLAERKGLLNDAFELPDAMDLDDNPIPKSMELGFPPQTPMTSVSEKSPLDMEVSGIGGIYPSDNFSINVKIRHARTNGSSMKAAHQRISSTYPNRLTATLPNHVTVPGLSSTLCGEVVSTRKRNLPPSELPPASCFVSIDGSESDDGSDSGSTMSIPLDSLGQPPPYAAPQVMQLPSLDSDGEEDDDDDDDDQASDGSLDFLATARAIDPESVIARERAYDMEMAERLAEDIPTGSSAATAEGGSGFASPVDGVSHAEIERARQALREQGGMPSLLRSAGSSDSMVVNGHLPSRA